MNRRVAMMLGLALGCGAPASAPPPVAKAPAIDETCGGRLARLPLPADGEDPALRAVTRPMTSLSVLAGSSPPLRIAAGPPADLEVVELGPRTGPELPAIDMSVRRLPAEVVAPGLRAEVAPHWKTLLESLDQAHVSLIRRAAAESLLTECAGCVDSACLRRTADEQTAAANDMKRTAGLEEEWLRTKLASVTEPTASELVAQAWVQETIARQGDDDIAPLLAPPIDLYARAIAKGSPDDALTQWAGYQRAHCLEDAARVADAKEQWNKLTATSVPAAFQAEAWLALGVLEEDPTRALAALARAREADQPHGLFSAVAEYRSLIVANAHGLPAAAMEAARLISSKPNFDDEASRTLAWVVDALGGEVPADAAFPTPVVALAAKHAARAALERGDLPRAEQMWRVVVALAPGSTEAKEASASLAKPPPVMSPAEASRERLAALAGSCPGSGTVDIVAVSSGISFKGTKDLAQCMERHQAFFLGSEPFKAKVVAQP